MGMIKVRNSKDLKETEEIKKMWKEYIELYTKVQRLVQEAVTKTIPREKKCKKAKWLSEEALQIPEERRDVKGKG